MLAENIHLLDINGLQEKVHASATARSLQTVALGLEPISEQTRSLAT